jgi:hypothetical protein
MIDALAGGRRNTPLPLSTSDTVLTDTPAAWATSLMVIFSR